MFASMLDGEEYQDALICYASRPEPGKDRDYEMTLMSLLTPAGYQWQVTSCRNVPDTAARYLEQRAGQVCKDKIQGLSLLHSGYRFYWLEKIAPGDLSGMKRELDELWKNFDALVGAQK
jgi:hypothetical protein